VNVGIDKLVPGVFGVSHGSGVGADIIRTATGSWAGHAFLYLGDGKIVEGTSPKARVADWDEHLDAIWAWRMWDQLAAEYGPGWTPTRIRLAQQKVAARGQLLVGDDYDWPAYLAFAAMVLKLRTVQDMAADYEHDTMRVCSGLVADALMTGGVPLDFVAEDGPGLVADKGIKVRMPPNLVSPGMLLGLAQRLEWI
jgi:hypothetical protein